MPVGLHRRRVFDIRNARFVGNVLAAFSDNAHAAQHTASPEVVAGPCEVDTDNVDPLPSPVDIDLKRRTDEISDGGYQEDIIKNCPESLEGYIVVPKVVE